MDRQNLLTTILTIVVVVLAIPPAIEASLNLSKRLAPGHEGDWRNRLRELIRPFTRPLPSWSVLLLIVLSILINSRMSSYQGTVIPTSQALTSQEQTSTAVETAEQTPAATQTPRFDQITPEVIETPIPVSTVETVKMVSTAAVPTETPTETPVVELCWMYAVREDDSLPAIAQVIYEDERQWPRICERNQAVLGDVPCIDTPPPAHRGQLLCVPVISPVKTYAVIANDNLETIADKFYGEYYEAPLAERICRDEANQDVIQGDCSNIRPGQVLSIRALDPVPSDSYLVAPGDSWRAIARAFYGTELMENDLRAANPDAQTDSRGRVLPGQVICLPGLREPMEYTVLQGDTLETLASRCGFGPLGPDDIYLINRKAIGLDQRDLQPGQVLTLYGCGF